MTMADDTARRRTRVATSAVYDTVIGERLVPESGSREEDMEREDSGKSMRERERLEIKEHCAYRERCRL
jgi:hypothetical protein